MPDDTLLRVENLKLYFRTTKGVVQAVDEVSFDLGYKEAVVVLGESGCGKTSLAKAILRLLPRNVDSYSGKVYLNDTDLMAMDDIDDTGVALGKALSAGLLSLPFMAALLLVRKPRSRLRP